MSIHRVGANMGVLLTFVCDHCRKSEHRPVDDPEFLPAAHGYNGYVSIGGAVAIPDEWVFVRDGVGRLLTCPKCLEVWQSNRRRAAIDAAFKDGGPEELLGANPADFCAVMKGLAERIAGAMPDGDHDRGDGDDLAKEAFALARGYLALHEAEDYDSPERSRDRP